MKVNYILFAIVGSLCIVCGCSKTPTGVAASTTAFTGPPAQAATRLTLLAVDRSKSTASIRSQLLTTTFDIGTSFDQNRDTMRLYRFGHSMEEVYSGLPEDDDSFAGILADKLENSDPVQGTDYPHMLAKLANTAADAAETEIRVVVVGDGENDYVADPKFSKCYRDAAVRLSQNPKIKWIRFWGVNVGTREEIRSVFKPLGSRLQILSLDQNPLAP